MLWMTQKKWYLSKSWEQCLAFAVELVHLAKILMTSSETLGDIKHRSISIQKQYFSLKDHPQVIRKLCREILFVFSSFAFMFLFLKKSSGNSNLFRACHIADSLLLLSGDTSYFCWADLTDTCKVSLLYASAPGDFLTEAEHSIYSTSG